MMFRRLVVWLMISSFLLARFEVFAQPHEQGVAAGTAANAVARGLVNAPSATAVVPGYTNAPPETAYAGRPSLGAAANAKLAACALTPSDPTCQALRNAVSSANTPRPAINASDPAVAAASRIARNPSIDLGSLAGYYSGCATAEVISPAHEESRTCMRYTGIGANACMNVLTVAIARTSSCLPGEWFAHAEAGSTGLDVQCLPDLPESAQHLRVTTNGSPLVHFTVDMTTPAVIPQRVAATAPVWVSDKSCSGDTCSVKALLAEDEREICSGSGEHMGCTRVTPFIEVFAACAAGLQSGNNLGSQTCSGSGEDYSCGWSLLDSTICYAPSAWSGDIAATDLTGTYSSSYWRAASARQVSGWSLNPEYGPVTQLHLSYAKPVTTVTASDTWNDHCPATEGQARCAFTSEPRCIDGPSTKTIDGANIARDCWAYQRTLSCASADGAGQCAPLVAAGCTPRSSTCVQANPATGNCEIHRDLYNCTVPGQSFTSASNCPRNVFCLGSSCFNTSYTNDADFARSMSMLEASREAGAYLDTNLMQVFKGEANRCRDKLLTSCCFTDGAGRGMTNQSVFGSGTLLVYDILMNSENREFVVQGMRALLTSAGFSGTFSTYGFTIAVNGSALPTGSTVLFSSSTTAGEGMVLTFDPWSLAITAVIYVILSMMECNEEEARLALKEGASLCHTIGTYCSSCLRILGWCVSCIERTTSRCCFNSMLARIVNEQGRVQIGKGWGGSENPDCSGFTIAQLQSLDFAAMDFTEFYASLVPTSPNLTTLQTNSASRVLPCYYGQGRCQ